MEKGTRKFKCPGCPVTIRILVSTLDYGKTVEGTCPKCGAPWRATIPVPAATPEPEPAPKQSSSGPFSGAFGDIFDIFGGKGR